MLLIEAANIVPLGPWHVWLFWLQGLVPRPMVKKKCLSTFWGTLAGNCWVFKLRSLLANLVANDVSFSAGRFGLKSGCLFVVRVLVLEGDSYSRMPATVELSNVPWPVTYGLAVMKNVAFGKLGLVLRRTFVVWPGAMRIVRVSKGLT
ncbi:hypothetical protein ACFX1X_006483 [Malus domestica]